MGRVVAFVAAIALLAFGLWFARDRLALQRPSSPVPRVSVHFSALDTHRVNFKAAERTLASRAEKLRHCFEITNNTLPAEARFRLEVDALGYVHEYRVGPKVGLTTEFDECARRVSGGWQFSVSGAPRVVNVLDPVVAWVDGLVTFRAAQRDGVAAAERSLLESVVAPAGQSEYAANGGKESWEDRARRIVRAKEADLLECYAEWGATWAAVQGQVASGPEHVRLSIKVAATGQIQDATLEPLHGTDLGDCVEVKARAVVLPAPDVDSQFEYDFSLVAESPSNAPLREIDLAEAAPTNPWAKAAAEVVQAHHDAFERCARVALGLARGERLGRFSLRLKISAEGVVEAAEAEHRAVEHPSNAQPLLLACLEQASRTLLFPNSEAPTIARATVILDREEIGRERMTTLGPTVMGSLDKDLVAKVVQANQRQILYCYEMQLNRLPHLSGKVVVKFVVSPTGSVANASVAQSTVNNAELESCMAGRVKTWQFPKPQGGGVAIVTYPFLFD